MMRDNTSWFGGRRRIVVLLAIILLGACIYCVIALLVNPWSRLYNEEQELDLNSGRARFTRHVFYCQVRQEITETPLSRAISTSGKQGGNEKWVKVNVFGLGTSNSPHFYYHGAFFQIGELATYWERGNFDQKAREKTAQQLLQVWRDGGSYRAARPYFEHLVEWIISRDSDQPTTADDIPDDWADRSLAEYAEKAETDCCLKK